MKRSLYGHTLVAIVVAIVAYVAWTKPKADLSTKVTVVAGSLERLSSLRWQEERWDVEVERAEEEFAVTVQKLVPPPKVKPATGAKPTTDAASPNERDAAGPKSDAGTAEASRTATPTAEKAEAEDAPPAVAAEPKRTFPASERLDDFLEKLIPLQAARSLGVVAEDRQKPMGFDKAKTRLTLSFGERSYDVEIGNSTYGSGDLYARVASGEVFLLPASILGSIRHGATSLLDKNAMGVDRSRVERLTISAGAQGREIAQRFAEEKEKRFFSDPAEPDVKLETASNWLDRMWRLRVVDFVEESSAPGATSAPAVEVEAFSGSESLGRFKLWRPDERVARGTSSRFTQPFTVSKASADALLADLQAVLSEGR